MINGRKLLPIKELATRSRYTRDYIAKLAREGVIVGAQVGRQWFVDEGSLASFTETSELESEVRNRHLSSERRRERELKQIVERQWDVIPQKPRYGRARATAATVAVLCLGVLSAFAVQQVPGAVMHIAALSKAQPEQLSVNVLPSAPAIATQFADDLGVSNEAAIVFEDLQTTEALVASSGVLFVPSGTASSVAAVAALFSDPVAVTFTGPGQGTVTGSSSAGTTSIPFVTVPVAVARDGSVVMPSRP